MPDGRQEPGLGGAVLDRHSVAVETRTAAKPDCDFAKALLRELTVEPLPAAVDLDVRFEVLPKDEAAVIWRALAGELVGYPQSKRGAARRLQAATARLAAALARCMRGITLIAAPICSTFLNNDALAIARQLRIDPPLRRRSQR